PARAIAILNWSAGKLQAAVADYGGTILALRAIEVSDKQAEAGVLDPGLELLEQALADAGLGPERLAAAVMGVPAPFRSGVGLARVKVAAPGMEGRSDLSQYYPLWLRTDPAIELSRRLGAPAVVENDANLGALGEAAFGAASEIDSFVYVKFGEGVGAGIVLDGRLHRGSTGFAGELAHVQVRDDGPLCACGGRGCLSGLLKTALTEVVDAAESAPLTFADLLARAEQGDGGSRRILRDLGRTIGRPLADLCTVLNPAAVIVDGALGPAGGHVVSGVRETIDRFAAPAAADAVQIALGTLGERADIYGGVALARDEAAFPSTSR
ncbi:MAG: ROK family protein, partial [Gaiellaceae bacterium]